MTDAGTGAATSEPRMAAGIGSGVNAGAAAGRTEAVASLGADGIPLAMAAALSAGTVTLLPSRGSDTVDEPAAASPLTAPARPSTASAVRSFALRLCLSV